MRKHFIFALIAIVSIMFLTSVAIATSPGQNKDGAGYYQHSVTGQIKYFKNHPGEPSQWRLISGDTPCGGDDCKSKGKIQGTFEQSTGAWKVDGDFEVEEDTITVNDGAFASSSQTAGGAYFGKYKGDGWGVGGVGSLGASLAYAKNDDNFALAGAVTGSITAAGVGGDLDKQCANINGEGEHMTLAVKSGDLGMAYAQTNGQYTYSGQVGQGVVIGGGITGGVSAAYMDDHMAASVAGGATVSGVGNINMGGYDID